MSKEVFFCGACRKKILDVEELLFVQESQKGFCSEDCIVNFYAPYMTYFDEQEIILREKYGLKIIEVDAKLFNDDDIAQLSLYSPDEVWLETNSIGEEFYTHIKNIGEEQYMVSICSYYSGEPAFIFFKTISKSLGFIEEFKKGVKIDVSFPTATTQDLKVEDGEPGDSLELPTQVIEDVELKKSEHLAVLIEIKKDDDIQMEFFHEYDFCLEGTLEDPDEIYKQIDEEGDTVMVHIKSYQKNDENFFYIVTCVMLDGAEVDGENRQYLMPIISFPSMDHELYKHYAHGEKIKGHLAN